MKLEEKIINCAYEINIENLSNKNYTEKNNFYDYIIEVIKNSHFSVKVLFWILITKIRLIYLISFIFMLNNNNEKKFIKLILNLLKKFFLLNNIYKLLKIYSVIYFYG